MADYSSLSKVVMAVGRLGPQGVQLLGTCFLLPRHGMFATAGHVTGQDDTNLVVAFRELASISDYQDTSDKGVKLVPARIHAYGPFHDTCVLSTGLDLISNIRIASSDAVKVREIAAIFGYPHADYGRLVLTYQAAEIGAKILVNTGGIRARHVVLNIQSRPGQSGSPVFSETEGSVVAILVGSYAPSGGGAISLGGIDPHTLHQTTHAVSAEYLNAMM